MKVKFFGTRGSIPIANAGSSKYGGNTTSVQIISDCLPSGQALAVDTGSGFVPMSKELLEAGVMGVNILYTHGHSDHTQGLLLAPHTYLPQARISVWGPEECGIGPQEMIASIMRPPFHPVDFAKVRHRFKCRSLKNIGTQVLVVHPEGRFLLVPVHTFEQAETLGSQLSFGGSRQPIGECLVIRMYRTVHPEYTVSYRFEERPTGRVFVFLTDHENTAAFPRDLLRHLQGAHLLVQDAQYSRREYESQTAGFGHGTPEYCAETAIAAKVERLGLTHHNPGATDLDIEQHVEEARAFAAHYAAMELAKHIFACADYQTVEV